MAGPGNDLVNCCWHLSHDAMDYDTPNGTARTLFGARRRFPIGPTGRVRGILDDKRRFVHLVQAGREGKPYEGDTPGRVMARRLTKLLEVFRARR